MYYVVGVMIHFCPPLGGGNEPAPIAAAILKYGTVRFIFSSYGWCELNYYFLSFTHNVWEIIPVLKM